MISCNSPIKNKKYFTTQDSLTFAIQGVWEGDENAPVWDIRHDSIFYYSENKSYYYFIHGNDMVVLYKNGPYIFKNIRIANDTFFFRTEGMNVISFRSKIINSPKKITGDSKEKLSDGRSSDKIKNSILGKWGYQYAEGVFSWTLTKDSIYYLQSRKTYYYKLIENNVVIIIDEDPIIMKDIIIRSDTMFFTTQDSIFIKAHKIH